MLMTLLCLKRNRERFFLILTQWHSTISIRFCVHMVSLEFSILNEWKNIWVHFFICVYIRRRSICSLLWQPQYSEKEKNRLDCDTWKNLNPLKILLSYWMDNHTQVKDNRSAFHNWKTCDIMSLLIFWCRYIKHWVSCDVLTMLQR